MGDVTVKTYNDLSHLKIKDMRAQMGGGKFVLSRISLTSVIQTIIPVNFSLSKINIQTNTHFVLSKVIIIPEVEEIDAGTTYEDSVQDDAVFDESITVYPYIKIIQDDVVFDDSLSAVFTGNTTVQDSASFNDVVSLIREFSHLVQDDVAFDDTTSYTYDPKGEEVTDTVEFGEIVVSYIGATAFDTVEFNDTIDDQYIPKPIIYESVYFRYNYSIDSNHKYLIDKVKFRDNAGGNVPGIYEESLQDDVAFDNLIPAIVNSIYEDHLTDRSRFFDNFRPISYEVTWNTRTRNAGIGYGGVEYGYSEGYGEGSASDVVKFRVRVWSIMDWSAEYDYTVVRDFYINVVDPADPDADASFTYTEAMQRTDHSGSLPIHCFFEVLQVDSDGVESPW